MVLMLVLMSWEFLLVVTVLAVLILPLLLKALGTKSPLLQGSLLFVIHLLPYALGFLSWLIEKRGDLGYYCKLVFFQWTLSWILVLICYRLCQNQRPLQKIYGVYGFSLSCGLVLFLLTPSLVFIDPLFGVIPGTFSMDPVIGLLFFEQRAQALIYGIIVAAILGLWLRLSPFILLSALWLTSLALDQTRIGAYSLRPHFETYFEKPLETKHFRIFVERGTQLQPNVAAWMEELRFHEQEIIKRLPHPPQGDYQSDIFLYHSDGSKYRATGARRVQIGNFLRGEMHLSGVAINSILIRHELVHLLHRHLDAPLTTYIDPLQFEGLAVAISGPSLQETLEEAAALSQNPNFKLKIWPHGLRFFSQLPPEASYTLAGGFAALSLLKQKLPWALEFDLEALKEIHVSEDQIKAADALLARRPLHKDPLARDCQRLWINFLAKGGYHFWLTKMLPVCQDHRLVYQAASELVIERTKALEIIAKDFIEAQADLKLEAQLPAEALALYKDTACRSATCLWKARALESGLNQELRDLLISGEWNLPAILNLQIKNPQAVEKLISLQNLSESLSTLQSVQRIRPLTADEKFQELLRRFYLDPLGHDEKSKLEIKSKLLSLMPQLSSSPLKQAKILEERLSL